MSSALLGIDRIRFPFVRLSLYGAGLLASVLLAGCGGGSSGCSSSSGYQIDGTPGMLSCGSNSGSTTSTSSVDPNSGSALGAAVSMSLNGTALGRFSGALPSGSAAQLAFTPATGTAKGGTSSNYSYTDNAGNQYLYCGIAGSGDLYYSLSAGGFSKSGTNTLTIAYPPFSNAGSFVVACSDPSAQIVTLSVTATP